MRQMRIVSGGSLCYTSRVRNENRGRQQQPPRACVIGHHRHVITHWDEPESGADLIDKYITDRIRTTSIEQLLLRSSRPVSGFLDLFVCLKSCRGA